MRAKFLYGLLIATMALSLLTVLAAFTFRDTAMQLRWDQLRTQTLNTQLAVVAKDTNNPVFSSSDADRVQDVANVRYVVRRLVATGSLGESRVQVIGLDLAQQERAMPFEVMERSERGVDSGLIVSRAFARDYGLTVDRQVEIDIPQGKLSTYVSAVVGDTGLLGTGERAVVSLATLQRLVGTDKVTSLGLSLVDLSTIQATQDAVHGRLPDTLKVEARFDTAGYESQVGHVQLALSIFSFFSVIMSVFMAASIMRRLQESRRRVLGAQRSLGTSIGRLRGQVLIESWIAFGIALSLGVLAYGPVLNGVFQLIGAPTGRAIPPLVPLLAVTVGFFLVVTAVAAATLRGVVRTPVVALLKGGDDAVLPSFPWRRCVAGVVLSVGVVALHLGDFPLPQTAAALPLLLVALALLLPGVHAAGVGLARALVPARSLQLPLRELGRRGRDHVGLLLLMSLVLCLFSVGTQVTEILRTSVAGVYGDTDVMETSWTRDVTETVCGDPDVTVCIHQVRYDTTYDGKPIEVTGIDGEYGRIAFENSRDGIRDSLAQLQRDPNGILITSTLAKNSGLAVGDDMNVPGIGTRRVLAVIDSIENSGKVQFVNLDAVQAADVRQKQYRNFVQYRVGTDIPAKVTALRERYRAQPFDAQSLVAMRADNEAATGKIFTVIWALFAFTFSVGMVTLVNNLWVGAFRRQTEVATKLSLGLSKRAFVSERFLVGGVLGAIGGVAGVSAGIAMTFLVVRLMNFFVGSARMSFEWTSLAVMVLATAAMTALASAVPAMSMIRRPLVDGIKGGE